MLESSAAILSRYTYSIPFLLCTNSYWLVFTLPSTTSFSLYCCRIPLRDPACARSFGPLTPLHAEVVPSWRHMVQPCHRTGVGLVAVAASLDENLVHLSAFGGLVQLAFQSILIASGNLSFLNVLTCVPAIWCFDDALLASIFGSSTAFLSGLTARFSGLLLIAPQFARSAMKHLSAVATTAVPAATGMNKRVASALPLRSLFFRHTPYVLIAALLASLSIR